MRKNERVELHQKSLGRVSKWPNTIQAERERKEYERIKKLEDDEVSVFAITVFVMVLGDLCAQRPLFDKSDIRYNFCINFFEFLI